MFKAKTKMVEPTSEAAASEVFVVADNIIPVRVASVDAILNTEFTEEMQVVPEKQVQQLIVENKTTNPMSKFFVRMSGYLDSMENFLAEMHSNYMNAIEQKKSIYQTEESDQHQRTHRSKSTARKLSDERKSNLPIPFGDLSDGILGLIAFNALGGVGNMMGGGYGSGGGEIQIVPYTPVAGQLVAKGKTDPTQGEKGYVSGYPLTSLYGWRWGRMHGGVDIGVPIGTKFALKEDAVIKFVGWEDPSDATKGYGLLVDAWVPSIKKMFRFGHLSSVAVKDGETIKAGSVLGASGNTGRSTGPHFHIEVHNQVTSAYGGDDPMPYIDYVIAGEEVQQRSEGSIERIGRIMVGEAGPEFVIPMSQMPIFAQLMMEEKIKSLNPYYISDRGVINDIGFERQSGFTNTMMAAGGITINNNHRIAARKLTQFFPGRSYLVAGILGNLEHESPGLKPDVKQYYGGPGRGIAQWEHYPDGDGRYPDSTGFDYGRWQTALDMYGGPVFKSLPKQLDFLKWELDTHHPDADDNSKLPSGWETRKYVVDLPTNVYEATYNFMHDFERPDKIAQDNWKEERLSKAYIFFDSMDKLLGRTTETQTERNQRERNTMDASEFFGTKQYKLDEIPGRVNLQSSNRLNSIPGNEQMRLASETQEQFSFDNVKGEIVALYQPTVYYTET